VEWLLQLGERSPAVGRHDRRVELVLVGLGLLTGFVEVALDWIATVGVKAGFGLLPRRGRCERPRQRSG